MPDEIESIDRCILAALQRDASMQNTELSKLVKLSPSACLRRVKLLEERGLIDRYVALLNASAVNKATTVFAKVTLDSKDKNSVEAFARAISKFPEVIECHWMAGTYDYLLRVVAADLNSYQRFQTEVLASMAGVRHVQTEIPLKQIKRTTELPV